MLLHQPLLPFRKNPPTKAVDRQAASRTAVAGPLVLKATLRVAAMARKATIPRR